LKNILHQIVYLLYHRFLGVVEHTIRTGDHRPVRQRPRRIHLAKIRGRRSNSEYGQTRSN
jgi:hypothetical protein